MSGFFGARDHFPEQMRSLYKKGFKRWDTPEQLNDPNFSMCMNLRLKRLSLAMKFFAKRGFPPSSPCLCGDNLSAKGGLLYLSVPFGAGSIRGLDLIAIARNIIENWLNIN